MHKLRFKIFIGCVGSLLLTTSVLSFWGISSLKTQLENEFKLRGLILTRTFAYVASQDLLRGQVEQVADYLTSLLADPDIAEARLLNSHGMALVSKIRTTGPEAFRPDHDKFLKVLKLLTPQVSDAQAEGHRYRIIYQRLWTETPNGIQTLGVCFLKLDYSRIDRQVRATILTNLAEIAIFMLLTLILNYFISRQITMPLERLRLAAEAVGQGRFCVSLPVDLRDEVGILARSFKKMAVKIQSTQWMLEKNIQEMIASRERLIQSEKMVAIGQLAAGVAHEINNPLGVILGFAQSTAKRIKEQDPLTLPIRSIEREALRCRNLVQSLLSFSRQSKPQMEKCDLNETIKSTLSIIDAQARVKSVEIIKELGSLEPFWGDKNQLQQIIVNLCGNAIDAMPNGGKIMVRTWSNGTKDEPRDILEIEDTGSGIPKEIREKIFNPFFTTKEVGKGTGLGLSLVYEIVHRHRGTIEVKSEVGKGTTFTVMFPINQNGLVHEVRP